jgi:hypothetical protein
MSSVKRSNAEKHITRIPPTPTYTYSDLYTHSDTINGPQLAGIVYYDDDDNKPVWPTWAVGALFRGARRIHLNRVSFHIIPPSLRNREILGKGRNIIYIPAQEYIFLIYSLYKKYVRNTYSLYSSKEYIRKLPWKCLR